MALSPKQTAIALRKFADAGFNVALVDGGLKALENDKTESQARVRKVTGKLAATIRVIKPNPQSPAARAGTLIFRLGAGSRSADRRKAVPYGRVLQTGTVYGSADGKTRPHVIQARAGGYSAGAFRTTGAVAFQVAGQLVFARRVHHPGSKFTAHPYLAVNQPRLATSIEAGLVRAADDALARASDFEGLGGS
jgi:hypothetical protein